ncbi:unnamed protein product [Calicophoron daubneyi]|uniref:Uncharacterized protein n=1 Tax=Calicophoron daubneyi TaxID=300641 RepID=A0AAV2T700_CALDB
MDMCLTLSPHLLLSGDFSSVTSSFLIRLSSTEHYSTFGQLNGTNDFISGSLDCGECYVTRLMRFHQDATKMDLMIHSPTNNRHSLGFSQNAHSDRVGLGVTKDSCVQVLPASQRAYFQDG